MLETLKSKFSSGQINKTSGQITKTTDEPSTTGDEPWWGQVTLAVGAVDEASKLTRALFTYFLTVSAYVAIAVFGTTQEMLLLDAGIELPIIGTQVPVNAFFILAPIFIVAFHGNLLVKLWALKKKAETQAGHIAERFDGKDGEAVRAYRELLFPYDFTMIVAGPKGRPVMRGAMSLIVALTVFIGPLALLFLIMQKFAPAGINAMTLFHGAAIAVDAAALALFRAGLRRPEMLRPLIGTGLQVLAIEAVGVLGLSLALIRFSLWMEDPLVYKAETRTLGQALEARAVNRSADFIQLKFSSAESFRARLALPVLNSDGFLCLVNPDVAPDLCPALRRGQLANDTVRPIADADLLAGQERLSDAVTQLCGAAGTGQLSLRERQLRGAFLGGMVAPCVDFQGSDLTNAALWNANLTDADLERANLTYADLRSANLTDADLWNANLTDADLRSANLTDAYLESANLTDADLGGAKLTDADLGSANFMGADLARANLTNADLGGANLTDAYLGGANLTDADLGSANLTDASLGSANLTNADLGGANLTDAYLGGATLTDASLGSANFMGADLARATLTDADLGYANLTDADLRTANLTDADLWRANLTDADLWRANLTDANLWNANLAAGKLEESLLFGTDLARGVMTGTSWGDDGLHPSLMLAFVDGACFAPLVLTQDEDGERVATCGDRLWPVDALAGLDLQLDELSVGDVVLEASPLPSNFDAFACVSDGSEQPIGTDGAPMSVKTCAHPDFRERMRWHFCGMMNGRGQQELYVGDDYLTEPNPLIITSETCADVGLGTDRESEWLEETFPDFDWASVPR